MEPNIRRLVDLLAENMRVLVEKAGLTRIFGDDDPGQLVVNELMQFAMYLTASDGEVSEAEAQKIAENFGFDLTPDLIGFIIRKRNIYFTEFEKRVPASMQFFVEVDNSIHEQGLDVEGLKPTGLLLYEVYELVGKSIIRADGIVDDQEREDMAIYLGMLRKYLEEHLWA